MIAALHRSVRTSPQAEGRTVDAANSQHYNDEPRAGDEPAQEGGQP